MCGPVIIKSLFNPEPVQQAQKEVDTFKARYQELTDCTVRALLELYRAVDEVERVMAAFAELSPRKITETKEE